MVEPESEVAYWLGALRRQSEDLRTDMDWLAPWLRDSPHPGQDEHLPPFQDSIPSCAIWQVRRTLSGRRRRLEAMCLSRLGNAPLSA